MSKLAAGVRVIGAFGCVFHKSAYRRLPGKAWPVVPFVGHLPLHDLAFLQRQFSVADVGGMNAPSSAGRPIMGLFAPHVTSTNGSLDATLREDGRGLRR